MSSNLNRPLAVITGGSRGIGAALVREFCAQGYDVVTYARSEVRLAEFAVELRGQYHTDLMYRVVDARSTPEIIRFAEFVISLKRPVDVLINNAGYFLPGSIGQEQDGTSDEMYQVNYLSAYHLTRSLLASMKELRSGHIINMCSVASLKAYPNGGSYSVSKTALLAFSRNLREELYAHGIRVTAVMPGATYTDSWVGSGIPEERMMPAEDVAKVIWMCVSLSSRSVVEEITLRPQLGDL